MNVQEILKHAVVHSVVAILHGYYGYCIVTMVTAWLLHGYYGYCMVTEASPWVVTNLFGM